MAAQKKNCKQTWTTDTWRGSYRAIYHSQSTTDNTHSEEISVLSRAQLYSFRHPLPLCARPLTTCVSVRLGHFCNPPVVNACFSTLARASTHSLVYSPSLSLYLSSLPSFYFALLSRIVLRFFYSVFSSSFTFSGCAKCGSCQKFAKKYINLFLKFCANGHGTTNRLKSTGLGGSLPIPAGARCLDTTTTATTFEVLRKDSPPPTKAPALSPAAPNFDGNPSNHYKRPRKTKEPHDFASSQNSQNRRPSMAVWERGSGRESKRRAKRGIGLLN